MNMHVRRHSRFRHACGGSRVTLLFIKPLLCAAVIFGGCQREPAPPAPRFDIWFGGDVHLGDRPDGALSSLKPLVGDAIGIVNLEGPIAERATKLAPVTLVNAPRSVAELAAAGVRIAGIANNHADDAGPAGVQSTIEALRKGGISPVGGPAGVVHLEQNGVRIVVTAHDLTNGAPDDLERQLFAARQRSDFLISMFHVTGSSSYLPPSELKEAFKIAMQCGASVVVAHGAHAIGPVGRKGGVILAWGLGNVAFACDCTKEDEAIIMRVKLEGRKIVGVEAIPITAGLNGSPARPARDPMATIDLLEAVGSPKLNRLADRGTF
jgi:hypothetical protein